MRFALFAFSLCIVSSLSAAEWSQYSGPSGDRISPESVGLTSWPASGPKLVWKTKATDGHSSFAVGGGRAATLIARDGQETCLVLAAHTGKELWAKAVTKAKYDGGGSSGARDNKGGDGPRSTPAIYNGKIYVYSSQLQLVCFDAATGDEAWRVDVQKEYAGRSIKWQSAASPVVDAYLVFVPGGGEGQAMLAFNKATGKKVWATGDEKMTHATPIVATIHGVRQVIFFTQEGLASFATTTGKALWRQNFPYKVSTAASPVVDGDVVYCSAGYGVGAGACQVSDNGGSYSSKMIWRKNGKLPNHWSTPIVKDGYLYGMFSFKEYGKGSLKCVDIRTGEEKWAKPGFGPGNVILSGDLVIALSDAGELALVKASTGSYQEVARAKVLSGKCWTTPVLSDGRIYARSTTQAVCLDVSGR
jgi:outer membrane protein assembly factor BamB